MIKDETVAKVGLEPTPAFGHPSDGGGLSAKGRSASGGKEFRDKSLCSPPGRGTRSEGWDQRQAAAAFTLTEVVVAAALMLLSLGLLLSIFVSSRRSVAITQNYLTALKIANSEAERLQTNSYASIGPTNTALTNTLIECQMSRSVVTTNSYKDITITVEWTAPISSKRQALTNYMTICNTN
ncbi:MAG: hypothetical protein Q7J98_07780 [Kiritimatiellia bacterium]|nr:hypothetical protein [Kiritimatiellia bacterium]